MNVTKPKPVVRKRDAAATRAAVLQAARKAFAAAGYDGAGLREIAAAAGVTAMMVGHYFGSKEQLFEAVVAHAMETPNIVTHEVLGSADLARDLATALVARTSSASPPLDGFQILLKSIANPRATEICRSQIERYHHRQMTEAIGGQGAPRRAALILAVIAGFQLMRQTMQLSALTEAQETELIGDLRSILALCATGDALRGLK